MTDKENAATDIGLESYQDETDEDIQIWEMYDLEIDNLKGLIKILDGMVFEPPIKINESELNKKIRKTLLDLGIEL